LVFKENSSNPAMHFFLAGNNWIFKKPCKVPEKDVWPGCSISSTRRSNCLLHVRLYFLLITSLCAYLHVFCYDMW